MSEPLESSSEGGSEEPGEVLAEGAILAEDAE